jgi:hypothetical protein
MKTGPLGQERNKQYSSLMMYICANTKSMKVVLVQAAVRQQRSNIQDTCFVRGEIFTKKNTTVHLVK